MTQQQQFVPGDVANGHVMTATGEWLPIAAPAANPPVPGGSDADLPLDIPGDAAGEPRPRKHRARVVVALALGSLLLVALLVAFLGRGDASPAGDGAPVGAASDGADSETIEEPAKQAEPALDLASFTPVDAASWAQIAKDPDAASGAKVVLFAEVTQFDTATGTDSFRANAGARQPAAEFELETNAVFGGDGDALADVTQGDVLRVYAEVSGSLEYETAIGGSTVVPALTVALVEEVGYLDITGDAVLGAPVWAEYGGVDIPVTVTNSSDTTMSYYVDVVAESPDGALQLGTASAYVDNLAAGQSAPTEANFYEDLPADAVIKVVDVERVTP